MDIGHVEDRVLDTDVRQCAAFFDDVPGFHLVRRKVDGAEGRLLDFRIIAPHFLAVLFQYLQFAAHSLDTHSRK